ncbi:hypothetical protein GH714_015004 [Hevea brasiliensis]|uniref:Uncharacterized protein n=1 Tax=Hevea brasiliensis TaxID=3981 RepID=A0A6A6KRI2_HEVBR|nr:hypothetical protein GH714_015004 [Hevea brasiliensis]
MLPSPRENNRSHLNATRPNILVLVDDYEEGCQCSTKNQTTRPFPWRVDEELSKSISKKAAKKEAAKQEKLRRRQEAALASAASSIAIGEEEDPLAAKYGNVPLYELQSKEETDLSEWTRVGDLSEGLKDKEVLIRGRAQTTRAVEVQVRKLHCISKAMPTLPINIEDAARSEKEIEEALQAGEQLVRVNQDTRLNYRVLDMRTPANQGIFYISMKLAV